jgi:putative ABC transport system ATP-binding protein
VALVRSVDVGVRFGDAVVLNGVSVEFGARESVAVMGPSGAGKSSLLYCLAGLRPPTSGRVLFGDVDLYSLSEDARADWRLRNAGFVFQRADLLVELTLAENIALPLEMRGGAGRAVRRRTSELIERLGLSGCADRRPAQVSGGQRQRAAVGRAVVGGPSVVFADEPTGALDSVNGGVVLDLLLEQCADVGALLVMVTHDPALAGRCHRVVHLRDGAVEQTRRLVGPDGARDAAAGLAGVRPEVAGREGYGHRGTALGL